MLHPLRRQRQRGLNKGPRIRLVQRMIAHASLYNCFSKKRSWHTWLVTSDWWLVTCDSTAQEGIQGSQGSFPVVDLRAIYLVHTSCLGLWCLLYLVILAKSCSGRQLSIHCQTLWDFPLRGLCWKRWSRKVCQRATACQKLIDQRSLQTFRKQSCGLLLIVSEGRALACALDFSLACALDLLWAKTWSNTTPPPHPRYECWWICMRASFCDWTSFSCGRVSERPHSGLHVKGR